QLCGDLEVGELSIDPVDGVSDVAVEVADAVTELAKHDEIVGVHVNGGVEREGFFVSRAARANDADDVHIRPDDRLRLVVDTKKFESKSGSCHVRFSCYRAIEGHWRAQGRAREPFFSSEGREVRGRSF